VGFKFRSQRTCRQWCLVVDYAVDEDAVDKDEDAVEEDIDEDEDAEEDEDEAEAEDREPHHRSPRALQLVRQRFAR